jgi:type II secretory pathway predicted ATPase ExeA
MNKKLLSMYGLKWDPFLADVPVEALLTTPKVESFCWRVEQQVREGGFASIVGDPGTGKSIALRLLNGRLSGLRDVVVGVLTRPQSQTADFYRELGDLFGVTLSPHNRWAGAKVLREKWLAHIEASLFRPVLLIDEAQEMKPHVLAELRLLSSVDLDARSILTVVLCGDGRLADKFRLPELVPIGSRIRVRLAMDYASRDELLACLRQAMDKAGNVRLMTTELMATLVDHASGNYRVLMTMAGELLSAAVQREAKHIDEKLYFEVFAIPADRGSNQKPKRQAKRR